MEPNEFNEGIDQPVQYVQWPLLEESAAEQRIARIPRFRMNTVNNYGFKVYIGVRRNRRLSRESINRICTIVKQILRDPTYVPGRRVCIYLGRN